MRTRDASSVVADVQSSESGYSLLNCGLDQVFFTAIDANFYHFNGWINFDHFAPYVLKVSFIEIDESQALDSISDKPQGYCSSYSRAGTFLR